MKRLLKRSVLALLLILFASFQFAYWTSTNDCGRSISPTAQRMKAIRVCEYGPPDVLKLKEVEKPAPAEDEILVRVHAASINFIDSAIVRGSLAGRLFFGLRKPKFAGFCRDFAGVVDAVGRKVTNFKPGDEVFGLKGGAVAQYVCARADRAAMKPPNLTFEQAAAVPLAGLTALQGLRADGIHPGEKVLVNGASGGVGTFALQMAKAFETEVTAVVSTRNVETARTLGADHVIDYTKEDFTQREERYDLLFDNVSNHSVSERKKILNSGGICVLAGLGGAAPTTAQMMGRIVRTFAAPILARSSEQKFVRYITAVNQADLNFLAELLAAGKVTPFIEKTYRLTETAEALRDFSQGHARGKIVIAID